MAKKHTHLFEGEEFILEDKPVNTVEKVSDEEINEKYKKGEIRIITEQARYPLDTIPGLLDSDKYDRNPEYQRRKRWNNNKKSKLIESFIMNVPIPPIFLYEIEYSEYEVMDGLQRLTAIDDFYKNKFELSDLEYWKELNGKRYTDLPEDVRKGIDRRYLSSIILLRETAKSKEESEFLKQIVFERLNSGGEKLTAQETRNALYNGRFNKFCIELAKNDSFRKMWKMPLENDPEEEFLKNEAYSKMEDAELVLRFFAYRHIEKLKGLSVEKFLDEYLKRGNEFPDDVFKSLKKLFIETIDIVYEIYGETAFYMPSFTQENRTPTRTIYDSMMQAFAIHYNNKSILINNREKIRDLTYADKKVLKPSRNKNLFDGKNSSRIAVMTRIDYFDKIIKSVL